METYSCSNELIHIPSKTTEETSQSEYRITEEQSGLSPKDITEFAVQWLEGRQSKKVASFRIRYALRLDTPLTHLVAIQEVLLSAFKSSQFCRSC